VHQQLAGFEEFHDLSLRSGSMVPMSQGDERHCYRA
jgi:hypothetical protein